MHNKLKSRLLSFRLPVLTALVSLIAVAIFQFGWSDALAYNRTSIAAGQIWRLATGHLTHWNADHLGWDLAMFAVLGTLIERRSRIVWLATVGIAASAISLALCFLHADLFTYRGLSGIDSALFTCAAIALVRQARQNQQPWVTWLLGAALLGFAGKIGYELITGLTLFVDSTAAGFVPLPAVHAVGGLVGIATACLMPGEEDISHGLAGERCLKEISQTRVAANS